jgi:hypothetical protein
MGQDVQHCTEQHVQCHGYSNTTREADLQRVPFLNEVECFFT